MSIPAKVYAKIIVHFRDNVAVNLLARSEQEAEETIQALVKTCTDNGVLVAKGPDGGNTVINGRFVQAAQIEIVDRSARLRSV